jgi:hypothetical protein
MPISTRPTVFCSSAPTPQTCHPVVFRRIKQRKLSAPDDVVIICVDPRRTETADFADLHLPIRPGSDIALFKSMLYVLLDENLIDRGFVAQHTNGFSALINAGKKYNPRIAQEICGIAECLIVEAALIFGKAERAMSLWSMGSIKARWVCTKTTQFITCIWQQERSANRVAVRSRSRASPTRWAGGRRADCRICCRAIAVWRTRSTVTKLNAIGVCRWAASRPNLVWRRWNSSKPGRKEKLKQSGLSAPIPQVRTGHRFHREGTAPSGAGDCPRRISPDSHEQIRSRAATGGAMEREGG